VKALLESLLGLSLTPILLPEEAMTLALHGKKVIFSTS